MLSKLAAFHLHLVLHDLPEEIGVALGHEEAVVDREHGDALAPETALHAGADLSIAILQVQPDARAPGARKRGKARHHRADEVPSVDKLGRFIRGPQGLRQRHDGARRRRR